MFLQVVATRKDLVNLLILYQTPAPNNYVYLVTKKFCQLKPVAEQQQYMIWWRTTSHYIDFLII